MVLCDQARYGFAKFGCQFRLCKAQPIHWTDSVRAQLLLAAQPKLITPVLQVVHRAIARLLLDQAELKAEQADSGAVTLIQPSLPMTGSATNLNIHLHCLVLDGDSDNARTLRLLQAAAWPCRPRQASGPTPRQAQTVHRTV